jgi:hypothetical protein
VLWLVESAAGFAGGDRAARAVHRVVVAALAAALGIQLVKHLVDRRGALIVLAGLAAAAGGAVLYRSRHVRLWLRYLAFAPVVFVVLFLTTSPVSDLVLPARSEAAGSSTGSRAPVVALFLDEFPLTALLGPGGTVDRRLFPNFAALADRATFYRNTTTVSPQTGTAVPALLTGRLPLRALAPTTAQYPDNLFTMLGVSYDMEVSELVTALCPADLCPLSEASAADASIPTLLGDAARVWRDLVSPGRPRIENPAQSFVESTVAREGDSGTAGTRPQPESSTDVDFLLRTSYTPARFESFVDGIDEGEGPTLHFLHLLLPHQPWRFLPSGGTYDFQDGRKRGERWSTEEWLFEESRQRLLLQTVYLDGLLGRLIDRLEAAGLWDRALFVLAGDHGGSFEPGQHDRALVPAAAPDLLWVPLFVKAPGQDTGRVDDRNALTVDVLPTIADLLDADLPPDVDGVSLAGPDRRTAPDKPYFPVPGKEVRLDPSPWFPDAVLTGMAQGRTRPERGPAGLYAVGPYGDLVGRSVRDTPSAPAAGAAAEVDRPGRYTKVDRAAPRLPAQVRGRLTSAGSGEEPSWIAIALNGRIAGLGRVYGDDERLFRSMADESAFRDGRNELELFLVRGAPGAARLEPVATG